VSVTFSKELESHFACIFEIVERHHQQALTTTDRIQQVVNNFVNRLTQKLAYQNPSHLGNVFLTQLMQDEDLVIMAGLDNGAHLPTAAGSILRNSIEMMGDLDTMPDFLSEESNRLQRSRAAIGSLTPDSTFPECLVTPNPHLALGLHPQSGDNRQDTQAPILNREGNTGINVIQCSGVQAGSNPSKIITKKPFLSVPLSVTLGSDAKELSDLLSGKHSRHVPILVHMYTESGSPENFSHFINTIRYIRSDQCVRLPSRAEGFVPLLESLESTEKAQHALHLYRKVASHRLRDYHANIVRSFSPTASNSVPKDSVRALDFLVSKACKTGGEQEGENLRKKIHNHLFQAKQWYRLSAMMGVGILALIPTVPSSS